MISQTDPRLRPELNHYACAFDCLAYFRERYQNKPWTAVELQASWDGALKAGIMAGDLNKDGDFDDPGELEILDWQKLADYLGVSVKYLGTFPLDAPEFVGNFVITRWFNRRTRFHHFVVGDLKPVEWDPIAGGSVTVREGVPVDCRIFRALVKMS